KGQKVAGFSCTAPARYPSGLALSPDGRTAAVCAGRAVHLIDAGSGKLVRTLQGHTSSAVCAAFSADGKQLVSGGDHGAVRVWGKELKAFRGHDSYVKAVAFGPDARHLLSGGSDASVRLWEVAKGEELKAFRKHTEPLVAVAFLAGGRQTLSASRDAGVQTWD